MRAAPSLTYVRRAAIGLSVGAVLLATTGTVAQADEQTPLQRLAASILATALPGQPLRVVVTTHTSAAPRIVSTTASSRPEALKLITAGLSKSSTIGVDIAHPVTASTTSSKDTYRSKQWALTRFHAESVWKKSTGTGVVVAVVDTGVRAGHPDLKGHVLSGKDYVDPGTPATDQNGHGTHVAGIIAAIAGNHRGVAGLARKARILPVRVLDPRGSGSSDDVAKGIIWAADHGANVINLSLGSTQSDNAERAAVAYAISKNVVVAAAAGNDGCHGGLLGLGRTQPSYPAAYPGVLGVGAISSNGALASYSDCGSWVDVVAPGSGIVSTMIDHPDSELGCAAGVGYCILSGTSMATPYASAAAALEIEKLGKGWKAATVQSRMQSSAHNIGAAGRDDASGYGVIDPLHMLAAN
jgi:type VII secretion-associated serine protease mycosin